MAYDIYGERLRSGHCEVHPHVHEEYPCHMCLMESQQRRDEQAAYDRHCDEQARAHYARMFGDDECNSWPPLIDTPRRCPLSQETVDEIRDRIESYQTVKEWGLADWCNEARKSTQLLFDILAEIEGKQ